MRRARLKLVLLLRTAIRSCGVEGDVHKIRICLPVFQLFSKNPQSKSLPFGNCLFSGLSVYQCPPKFEDFRYPATIIFLLKLDCEVHVNSLM